MQKIYIDMSTWNDLSIPEKAEMMRVAIANGITTLPEIRQAYNQFAEGGDTVGEWVDAIYQSNPKEEFLGEPEHHYDFTQSEEWADAHGYYPDARGHRDDRVKKPAHPSHPSRGIWEGDKFVLSDLGMQNPNYTLFGLNDGGQDSQAVLTYQGGSVIPEITATPNGNYIYNPYDNIRLSYSEGGNLFGDGSYMSKAKSLIKNNEGWRATPYKDAPAGKSWRSVGYGFNDSGFRDRYPEGISKHYEKGITKAQAEKELDYYLGKAEKTLKGIYGKQWDRFNDNQKAAILDTYYQRPASVGKGSSFYNAVKAGKDGTNYLGVSGYGKRNKGRREMFSGMKDIPVTMEVPEEVAITPMMPEEIPFTPWNPQALANEQPLVTYTPPTLEAPEPLVDVANAYTQEALEKEQRQRNLNTLDFVLGITSPQGSDNSLASTISMLTGSGFAKGGKIHIKPSHRGRLTELKKRTNKSEAELYKTGGPAVRKMITFARNARKWKHGLGGPLFIEDL